MAKAGHTEPNRWKKLLHTDALLDSTESNLKRFLVNRALRMALADAPEGAPFERYCLPDSGELSVWIKLVEESVVPTIVRYNLPRI